MLFGQKLSLLTTLSVHIERGSMLGTQGFSKSEIRARPFAETSNAQAMQPLLDQRS